MERASVCDNYRRRMSLPEGKLHGITHSAHATTEGEVTEESTGFGTLLKGTSTVLRHSRSSSLSPDSGGCVFKPHSCRLVTSNTADLMFPFSASSRITQTAWRLPGSFRFKSSLGADIWTLTVVFCSMGNITDGCSLSWPSNVAAFTKSLTTQGLGLFYTCPHQPPSWQIPEKGKSAKQLRVLCAECWFSCLFPVIIKY